MNKANFYKNMYTCKQILSYLRFFLGSVNVQKNWCCYWQVSSVSWVLATVCETAVSLCYSRCLSLVSVWDSGGAPGKYAGLSLREFRVWLKMPTCVVILDHCKTLNLANRSKKVFAFILMPNQHSESQNILSPLGNFTSAHVVLCDGVYY